jgi:hypothetical protein
MLLGCFAVLQTACKGSGPSEWVIIKGLGYNSPFEAYMMAVSLDARKRLTKKEESEGLTDEEKKLLEKVNAWIEDMDAKLSKRQKKRTKEFVEKAERERQERLAQIKKRQKEARPHAWGGKNQPWPPDDIGTGRITTTGTGLPAGATVVSVRIGDQWYTTNPNDPPIPGDWSSRANEVYYVDSDGTEHHVSNWMPTLPTNTGWSDPRAKNFTPPNQGLIQNRE